MSEPMKQENLGVTQSETRTCGFQTTAHVRSIKEAMLVMCDVNGYVPTENLEKIAKAKERFFTEAGWSRCCCDKDNPLRFCISPLCKADIERDGCCKCRAYRKAGA